MGLTSEMIAFQRDRFRQKKNSSQKRPESGVAACRDSTCYQGEREKAGKIEITTTG
jgi:hypothetical protein